MELNQNDPLKNIDSSSYHWNCRVRLQTLWKGLTKDTKEYCGMNMVLIDDSNTRIHAFANAKYVEKGFEDLKEGDIFNLSNFRVKEYKGNETFRAVRNVKHIFFTSHTEFVKDDKPGLEIEKYAFDICHMDEIDKFADDGRFLIDMIGKVVNVQELVKSNKNNEEKTRFKFDIFDGRNTVKVTFFDQFAEKVEQELLRLKEDDRYIIISCANVKRYEGTPYLSNYSATRVYINPDHYSLNELKKQLAENVALQDTTVLENNAVLEEMEIADKPRTILSVKEIKKLGPDFKEQKVYCQVTVKKMEDKEGWYYRKCTGCDLELNTENGKFICSGTNGCRRVIPYPDKRFRVCTLCSDKTGSIAIMFPDEEITRIIDKTVFDIHCDCLDEKEEEKFPDILKIFLKKEYIITIQLEEDNLKKGSNVYQAKEISQILQTSDNFQIQQEVVVEQIPTVDVMEEDGKNNETPTTPTVPKTNQTPTTGNSTNNKNRGRNIIEPVQYISDEPPKKKPTKPIKKEKV